MDEIEPSERLPLIQFLAPFITENKKGRIESVLAGRTRHITVVAEDVYQPHNAAAVLRTCDLFGIQDVHVVEDRNSFDPATGVTLGCEKWLTFHKYQRNKLRPKKLSQENPAAECLKSLRNAGYKIIVTAPGNVPDKKTHFLSDYPVDQKTALIFGTEKKGVSDFFLEQADELLTIPMVGFSESFNISVSMALCLYDLTSRMRKSSLNWALSPDEKLDLQLEWYLKCLDHPSALIRRFKSGGK